MLNKRFIKWGTFLSLAIALILWLFFPNSNSGPRPLKVILDSKIDMGEYTMEEERWKEDDVVVRRVKEKDYHPLDGGYAWFTISITDGSETILYHIIDYGGDIKFEDNQYIVNKINAEFAVGGFYGWKKIGPNGEQMELKSSMIKYLPENTDSFMYIFTKGFILELGRNNGLKAKRTIMSYGDIIGVKNTIPDFTFGIYKVANDSLVKINAQYNRLEEGTYYIPYPGEGTKSVIDLHKLAELLRSCKAKGQYPDVLFEGDILN